MPMARVHSTPTLSAHSQSTNTTGRGAEGCGLRGREDERVLTGSVRCPAFGVGAWSAVLIVCSQQSDNVIVPVNI